MSEEKKNAVELTFDHMVELHKEVIRLRAEQEGLKTLYNAQVQKVDKLSTLNSSLVERCRVNDLTYDALATSYNATVKERDALGKEK